MLNVRLPLIHPPTDDDVGWFAVDIYDGPNGPVVTHGKTLTSSVLLSSVCQAIQKYAFVTSAYPIIISAEVRFPPFSSNIRWCTD